MNLATAAEMKALDRSAIDNMLIPGVVLMENAGRGTVQVMVERHGPLRGKAVPIYVGPGNNGGDGLVIARVIHEQGGIPLIFFLVNPDILQGDAQVNWEIVARIGLKSFLLDNKESSAAIAERVLEAIAGAPVHSQVDAIFGIGLTRDLSGIFRETVLAINRLRDEQGWPTVAVDIPSGLATDTGAVHGAAVRADCTVTYGLPKPTHFINGSDSTGHLAVVAIGIPPEVIEQANLAGSLIDTAVERFIQAKPNTAHKGSNGHLLVLAGSEGKTGAALLCALGALHSGVGLVTMAVPERLNPVFEASLAEAMSVPLPGSQNFLSDADYPLIVEMLKGKDACVIGPGLGTSRETMNLVQRLYQEISQPMIVDADALNLLAPNQGIFAQPGGPRILTPHPGEMARLASCSIREVQQNRINAACWQCGTDCAHALITVLKGAGTVVADATGRWAINTTGNPGMATGGMGDVLAGMIASLVAQGYSPWRAASLGVYLHGKAADEISLDRPMGFLASEVAAQVSRVIGRIIRKNREEQPC